MNERRPLFAALLVGGLAVAIILIAYGIAYFNLRTHHSPGSTITVALNSAAGQLQAIDSSKNILIPVTVAGPDGKMQQVIDQLIEGDQAYYLLVDSNGPASNLYEKKGKSKLVRLTDSKTRKYGLSHDQSGLFAYQAAPVGNASSTQKWNVTVFNPATRTEQVAGANVRASRIIEGGHQIILQQDSGMYLATLGTNQTYKLMNFTPNAVAAIAPDASVAFYNATTSRIDIFSFTHTGTLSYNRSTQKVPAKPAAIGFVRGEIVAVYMEIKAPHINYVVWNAASGKSVSIPSKTGYSLPARLIAI